MNDFFFLAAGFGKRMQEWTHSIPKPLLEIDGITFLDFALYNAWKWGVNKSWINVHYLGDKIIEHLENFSEFPIKISFEKKEILGTAGGIRTAIGADSTQEFIVIYNPDTLLFPSETFQIREQLPANSKIHLYLQPQPQGTNNYTRISMSEDGRLRLGEGNFFYIGLALLDPKLLETIPLHSVADLSPIFKFAAANNQLTGELFDGNTLDLGEKELYESYLSRSVFGQNKEDIMRFVDRYLK